MTHSPLGRSLSQLLVGVSGNTFLCVLPVRCSPDETAPRTRFFGPGWGEHALVPSTLLIPAQCSSGEVHRGSFDRFFMLDYYSISASYFVQVRKSLELTYLCTQANLFLGQECKSGICQAEGKTQFNFSGPCCVEAAEYVPTGDGQRRSFRTCSNTCCSSDFLNFCQSDS